MRLFSLLPTPPPQKKPHLIHKYFSTGVSGKNLVNHPQVQLDRMAVNTKFVGNRTSPSNLNFTGIFF